MEFSTLENWFLNYANLDWIQISFLIDFFLLLWCERKFMRIVWRRLRSVRSFDLISYWLLLCTRKCEKSSSWCDNLLIQKWIKRSFSCVAFDELFYLLIVYWFFLASIKKLIEMFQHKNDRNSRDLLCIWRCCLLFCWLSLEEAWG